MDNENSNDKASWVSPALEPLTGTSGRADRMDIPLQNSPVGSEQV
jgi:hypothetical protein